MKTSKFSYKVYCSNDPNELLALSVYSKVINCVTLAEARLVAARSPTACIQCVGEIFYKNGLEVFDNGN